MAITRNPVTAFVRKADNEPPKPPKPLQTPEEYAKAFGAGGQVRSKDDKSTASEEARKLRTQAENLKLRLGTEVGAKTISPKRRQDLIADVDRIAAGEKRQVNLSLENPAALLGKLKDVAMAKVLAPFASGSKTLATAGGDFSLQKQGEAWGGAISGVTGAISRIGQSAIKEISDQQLSSGNPVMRAVNSLNFGPVGPLAALLNAGTKKSDIIKESTARGDTVKTSLTDFINQAKDPDWDLKKTVLAEHNVKRNKIVGNIQNTLVVETTNPWNYITGVGEAQYVGKAGRLALAQKFGTLEMLAKYPQLAKIGQAGVVNTIGRFGIFAIPREVRLAEGISTGIRVAGSVVPATDFVGQIVGKGLTTSRANIGDIARNAVNQGLKTVTKNPYISVGSILTPASRQAVRQLGQKVAGTFALDNADAVAAVASYSAGKTSKGQFGWQYNVFKDQVKGIVEEARTANIADKLVHLAENPNLARTAAEDVIVKKYVAWQQASYGAVEAQYRKFGLDFNAVVSDFSWIDNYVHHTISNDAKRWIRNLKGFENLGKKGVNLNPAHMNFEDITEVGAPLRYRKLKIGEEFMGEEIQSGTLDEINQIFKRQTGNTFNFFETDIGNIADSYSYSLAKQSARETFSRRLMAFGDDAVQKLLTNTIPDRKLAGELLKAHKGLVAVRATMRGKSFSARTQLRDIVQRGVAHAENLVKDNQINRKLTQREINGLVPKLRQLEIDLNKAKIMASTVEVELRHNFETTHNVLLNDIVALRNSIENGLGAESEVRHTLQQTYMTMFPNATKIPDDVQVLADRIMAARGIPAARETRALNAELKQIRQTIELTDPKSPEYAALLEKEAYYKDLSNGYRVAGDVRATQTYAPDNSFLYTTGTDMNSPDAPFQLLHSEPTLFAGAPDLVGVHVMPDENLLDSRTSDGVQAIFGSEEFVQSIDTQLQDAGLDSGRVFIKTFFDLQKGLPLDPEIERGYPDLVDLIKSIMGSSKQEIPSGGDPELIHSIYSDFLDIATGIAHMSGMPDADIVGETIIKSALGDVALAADLKNKKDGLLLPAMLFDETADSAAIVVVKPSNYNVTPSSSVTAPIQGADSRLLTSIMNSDYTTASDIAKGHLTSAQNAKEQLSLTQRRLLTRIEEIGARKSALTVEASARTATVNQAMQTMATVAGDRTVVLGGQRVVLNREGIDKAYLVASKQEARLRANLERTIAKDVSKVKVAGRSNIANTETQLLQYQDRLKVLFDQARNLKQWNDTTGNALRGEIQSIGSAMLSMPARGEAGAISRDWVRAVQSSVEQTKFIKDKTVAKAYERVTQLLHVSEIGLSQAEDAVSSSRDLLKDISTGRVGAILDSAENNTLEGWEAILGLGVQAPQEMLEIWKPNLQKMMAIANRPLWRRGLAATNQMFKTYAVTSVGFIVRNSYSSMFMNGVAGVNGNTIVDGMKAMRALNEFGYDRWLDELKIVDPIIRGQYEDALKAAITTGLQGSFTDLREPVVGGTMAERIINKLNLETLSNKVLPDKVRPVGQKILETAKKQGFVNNSYTRGVRTLNTKVEAAVRFPMALDTILKGGTFDDAVSKVTRYHFDYSDVSKLDEAAQNLLPFWIWTTRNIPNQITNQWMRPQAYSIWEGVQTALPIDDDRVVPSWMKSSEPMGIAGTNLLFNPDMPMDRLEDAIAMLTSPLKLIGNAYPQYKLPVEYAAGKQLGIDVGPFQNDNAAKGIDAVLVAVMETLGVVPNTNDAGQKTISGFAQYALGNINPMVARLQRLTGGMLGGKASYETRLGSSWLNELGIPINIITDDQVRSEYINRKFKAEDFLKDLIGKNILPKEKPAVKPPESKSKFKSQYNNPKGKKPIFESKYGG